MSERIDLASLPLRALLAAVDDQTLAAELLLRVHRARREGVKGITKIRAAVARFYGIRPSEIVGNRRHAHLAGPRQIAMYLAREQGYSLSTIARAFNRHHTTVLHACRCVGVLEGEDLQTAMSLSILRAEMAKMEADE